MAEDSRVFTVTTIVETADGVVVAHFDYQGSDRQNEAMKKWHNECAYNRGASTVKYFCAYITNEWGGVECKDTYTNPDFTLEPITEL